MILRRISTFTVRDFLKFTILLSKRIFNGIWYTEKSAAVKRKLILVTAKHLAGSEQVNVRRSLNELK